MTPTGEGTRGLLVQTLGVATLTLGEWGVDEDLDKLRSQGASGVTVTGTVGRRRNEYHQTLLGEQRGQSSQRSVKVCSSAIVIARRRTHCGSYVIAIEHTNGLAGPAQRIRHDPCQR